MAEQVVWYGSQQEALDLVNGINRNCVCEFNEGLRLNVCAPHKMLLEDQRALNGLLFGRRIEDRLRAEETKETLDASGKVVNDTPLIVVVNNYLRSIRQELVMNTI